MSVGAFACGLQRPAIPLRVRGLRARTEVPLLVLCARIRWRRVDSARNEPGTFAAIVCDGSTVRSLDFIWKRSRGPVTARSGYPQAGSICQHESVGLSTGREAQEAAGMIKQFEKLVIGPSTSPRRKAQPGALLQMQHVRLLWRGLPAHEFSLGADHRSPKTTEHKWRRSRVSDGAGPRKYATRCSMPGVPSHSARCEILALSVCRRSSASDEACMPTKAWLTTALAWIPPGILCDQFVTWQPRRVTRRPWTVSPSINGTEISPKGGALDPEIVSTFCASAVRAR